MARVLDCPCRITMNGADDEELFWLGREHVDAHHRDGGITDELIRGHIADNARDIAVA